MFTYSYRKTAFNRPKAQDHQHCPGHAMDIVDTLMVRDYRQSVDEFWQSRYFKGIAMALLIMAQLVEPAEKP